MERNDYSYIDSLLSNLPPARVINEAAEATVTAPSVPVVNPPAEKAKPTALWLDEAIKFWQDLLKRNPDDKEIAEELAELMKKKGTGKEGEEETVTEAKGKRHKVTITIDTSNDMFDEMGEAAGIKWVLTNLSRQDVLNKTKVMDSNGNSVGTIDTEIL